MNKKILVLYVFDKMNNRVFNFIKNCIFEDNNIDYIIISNGYDGDIDVPSYVKILKRQNIGYDFGGWSEAILKDEIYNNYDYYIFINSSVIGAFIPFYCEKKWPYILIDGLNHNIKLFGITINTEQDPINRSHVQSYLFCVNKETLIFLIKKGIFSNYNFTNIKDVIEYKEVLMSRHILNNGWNIGALCNYYKDVDFKFIDKMPIDYEINFIGDIMYPKYRDIIWNEYQLIFIKGNRFGY